MRNDLPNMATERKINPISAIATMLSISGAVAIAFQSFAGYLLWIIANSLWIVDNLHRRYYEQIPIWIVFIGTSILGLMVWLKVI